MTLIPTKPLKRRALGAAAMSVLALAASAGQACAQRAPSTLDLMRLLVRQGVITQAAADALMAEATREAAAEPQGADAAPMATNLPPPSADATRIFYVPKVVRDEIRDQVVQQAKAENWAQPNAIPEWTKRIVISGDVRLRAENDLYSKSNDTQIINFAALNSGGPVDINPATDPNGIPFLDSTENRDQQLLIRARLDVTANPSDWVTADIRMASGSTNNPVSTSQLLGGGLTKKNFWLDRAYLDIHPTPQLGATLGRMPNPFVSTTLLYANDLNFDGALVHGTFEGLKQHGLTLFGATGAFLTGYQDTNFPTDSDGAHKSHFQAKWMIGSQGGVTWKTDMFKWTTSVGYYSFQNSEGQLSDPCALYTGANQCSTDFSRPDFMQKGNTLFLIRNITPNPSALPGTTPLPQYVGLMFPFHVLDLVSTIDIPVFGKQLELTGDYARNLAYKFGDACRFGESGLPVNNIIAPGLTNTDVCSGQAGPNAPHFHSGPNAYMVRAGLGDPDPFSPGQWNLTVGYKHLAPDSVVDAYNDPDFHLGGTNAKGYFLMATLGLLPGSNMQLRWFSADQVYGVPLSIDTLQLDLNARF